MSVTIPTPATHARSQTVWVKVQLVQSATFAVNVPAELDRSHAEVMAVKRVADMNPRDRLNGKTTSLKWDIAPFES